MSFVEENGREEMDREDSRDSRTVPEPIYLYKYESQYQKSASSLSPAVPASQSFLNRSRALAFR
jgi:hypothetical protein